MHGVIGGLGNVFGIWEVSIENLKSNLAESIYLGEKIVEGYQTFITALKCDPSYAPAFTCLGVYYAEHASPPDPTRASKCFQKAFELDSKEADAAHRLAKGFADEQEWDLVEVIARRTIEGEGGLDGGLLSAVDNLAEKYLPTNAWAWKALGIVNLVITVLHLFYKRRAKL